jgi:ABC-type transporter Mla MlaB component
MHDVYAPDGHFDPHEMLALIRSEEVAALPARHRQLRAVADMSPARSGVSEPEGPVAFERGACEAVTSTNTAVICQYDSRVWNAGEVGELRGAHAFELCCSVHPTGSESLQVVEISDPPTLRLAGELDVLNVSRVTAAMRRQFGEGPARVDLHELRFADLGGLRALLDAAVDGVTLVAPQPLVQAMLELTHWDRRPGVRTEKAP